MALAVNALPLYPVLKGLTWPVVRSSNVKARTQTAVSGRQFRIVDQAAAIYEYTLTYTYLRDKWDSRAAGIGLGVGFDERRTLEGFFLQLTGSFGVFVYDDPSDDTVTGQYLATGTGSFSSFQLIRFFGSANYWDIITDYRAITAIYYNGVSQALVEFSSGPPNNPGLITDLRGNIANGVVITADFTYLWRCHFKTDSLSLENFLYQLFSGKEVKFETVLL